MGRPRGHVRRYAKDGDDLAALTAYLVTGPLAPPSDRIGGV